MNTDATDHKIGSHDEFQAARAPKGRDDGAAWQTWIRRHDEYA